MGIEKYAGKLIGAANIPDGDLNNLVAEPIMNKRIYKHICKECETVFYVENLKLLSACYCPSCHSRGLYIEEFKCVR